MTCTVCARGENRMKRPIGADRKTNITQISSDHNHNNRHNMSNPKNDCLQQQKTKSGATPVSYRQEIEHRILLSSQHGPISVANY